jgi:hypothetical protein
LLQFGIGWWILIDATVTSHVNGAYQLCGVGATIALFMFVVNICIAQLFFFHTKVHSTS